MAEAQLQQFLEKVRQLNAFVALSEASPELRQQLQGCSHHHEVVDLARSHGFEIGRRWGEGASQNTPGGGWGAGRHSDSNLLSGPCPRAGLETTSVLLEEPGLRLERIHSCQSSSPPDFWYEQSEHEWVVLLQGSAQIAFEGEAQVRQLCRGDSLLIPAHRPHRLVTTDPAPGSVWLALFWREAGEC